MDIYKQAKQPHTRLYCPTDGCLVCMPPIDPCPELRAEVERLREQVEEVESYAKEGWDWLQEALDALGVETVFDIPNAEQRDRYREALERYGGHDHDCRIYLLAASCSCGYRAALDGDDDE